VPANPDSVVSSLSFTQIASPASSYNNISSCIVSSINSLENYFCVNVIVKGINRSICSSAIIDSGAITLFISKHFVQCYYIICSPLPNTIVLYNIDSSKNKAGSLTHFACLTLTIDSWNKLTNFLVTDLGPENIVLGLPWLKKVNSTIDWDLGEMEIPNSPEQFTPSSPQILEANCFKHQAWIKAGIITDTSNEIWICAGYTLSTKLAVEAGEGKAKKTFEELIPKEYQCHAKVFSETESHRLPKHQP
jgi:predicted aspartyl protease